MIEGNFVEEVDPKKFKRSRYELLEEAVYLLRSKGVNPESVLYAVSKACYCDIKFTVGNVKVTFCSIGFDDDEESLRKRIVLSLEYGREEDWEESQQSCCYFRVGELAFLSKLKGEERQRRRERH